MNGTAKSIGSKDARLIGLALTTALAGVTLAGCAHSSAQTTASAGKPETAITQDQFAGLISKAENAVAAQPENATLRTQLGAAYLDAGRFSSAAASFEDAMALGDRSPRTALSLALALSGDGRGDDAARLLDQYRDDIAASDLGLAYSLAGKPGRGIDVLSIAIRNGENNAKTRQNLAYSYALNGQWREARLMAEQDLGSERVGDRMAEWAAEVHPDAYRQRVAALLQVTPDFTDPGQPARLALTNTPGAAEFAAQATAALAAAPSAEPGYAAYAPTSADYELAPIGDAPGIPAPVQSAPKAEKPRDFDAAFNTGAAPASPRANLAMDTQRFVQGAAPAKAPAKVAAAPKASTPAKAAAPARAASSSPVADGTHLVQLGSFSSETSARRAWGIYVKRYPELANHQMVISEAVVKGKRYWRVSAGGYNSASARSMCGKVNSSSRDGCFAYAESSPMPGAVLSERRFASR